MCDFGQKTRGNVLTVTLREIFDWGKKDVDLPALQRSFVWKPAQVERIWDSLVRGFPVGGFLFSPYGKGDKGSKHFGHGSSKTQATNSDSLQYYLLDGQQRATAMRLASVNPWSQRAPDEVGHTAVLWVDIAPKIPEGDDRVFLFRVLTIAHPWGYKCDDPGKTLTAEQMRDASNKFLKNSDAKKSGFDNDWDLRMVWPIDACKPVPLCLLWQAVENFQTLHEADLAAAVWQWLSDPEHWPDQLKDKHPERTVPTGEELTHLTLLCQGLQKLVTGSYVIPSVVLEADAIKDGEGDDTDNNKNSDKPDSVQTLFLRTQRGGTTLEGEELYYSMLKAEFGNVDTVIQDLSYKFAPPSRLAILLVRLTQLLPSTVDAKAESSAGAAKPVVFPGYPSLKQFRQWGRDKDFQVKFAQNIPIFQAIFQQVRALLVDESKDFTLPSVLAVHVFRTCPNVMLVLLYWLYKMVKKHNGAVQLDNTAHRKLLGILTAISWFAVKESVCAERLWEVVRDSGNALEGVWDSKTFLKLFPVVESSSRTLCLVPPPPPKTLEDYFNTVLLHSEHFGKENSALWKTWHGYPLADHNDMNSFFQKHLQRRRVDVDLEKSELEKRSIDAWNNIVARCKDSKALLLYAQRAFICGTFPNFDPSVPKRLEDSNTPWDYDHIHAHALIAGELPLVKYWHNSIGNLRAWPASLNRSDSCVLPKEKLQPEKNGDGGWGAECIRTYSAITVDNYKIWLELEKSEKQTAATEKHALRKKLVTAIVQRMLNIYATWYTTLHLEQLMTPPVKESESNTNVPDSSQQAAQNSEDVDG